jgi:hypothetical protein
MFGVNISVSGFWPLATGFLIFERIGFASCQPPVASSYKSCAIGCLGFS